MYPQFVLFDFVFTLTTLGILYYTQMTFSAIYLANMLFPLFLCKWCLCIRRYPFAFSMFFSYFCCTVHS